MNLDFLSNVTLADAATTVRKKGEAKTKFPTDAHLRVYRNGEVYPSPALATAWGLEYMPKTADTKGYGIDLIDSKYWAQANGLPQRVLFCAAAPRKEGRVDLFSSTQYDDNGQPTASVLSQGATTTGKELLTLLKEIYDVEISPDEKEAPYIDLVIAFNRQPLKSSNGIYNIPKKVARGEKAGELTYVRRENLNVYALVPKQFLEEVPEPTVNYGADELANQSTTTALTHEQVVGVSSN